MRRLAAAFVSVHKAQVSRAGLEYLEAWRPTDEATRTELTTSLLARTPAALDALLRDLPDVWTRANEGRDTWSAFDVVGHLIHGELTDWMPRARMILECGESRPFDTFDRLAQFRESEGKSLPHTSGRRGGE